jgi:ribosomal RNA-processing protein 17
MAFGGGMTFLPPASPFLLIPFPAGSSTIVSQSDEEGPNQDNEEQFEDEEAIATVVVVEDFDPDTVRHGTTVSPAAQPPAASAPLSETKPAQHSKKTKPTKIKYQTRDARKAESKKQQQRKQEKARLAGTRSKKPAGARKTKKK